MADELEFAKNALQGDSKAIAAVFALNILFETAGPLWALAWRIAYHLRRWQHQHYLSSRC